MKYYNLGTCNKPCGILRWRGLTIMLDCSLDISTVLNFLPLPLAGNSKFTSAPHFQNYRATFEKELCEINNYVFIDSTPLFGVPLECSIDVSEIDVVLISNSSSILALPFFTENPEFRGNVYATEPTVNIGRFYMEELVEFVTNVPKPRSETSKDSEGENVYKMLESALNFPVKISGRTFNRNLKEIYSKKTISDALMKIKIVGFNETIDIFGKVDAVAVSSGFSLGSCNWVLKSEKKKIVYVTFSSALTTHPTPMEQAALKDADVFLLTGLTRVPGYNPDAMMGEVCVTTLHAFKAGGNVIFPLFGSGVIYDLFECLTTHLDSNGFAHHPYYFISPHAESSLAYSNILAEWLSHSKQKRVYIPDDPFPHAQLVKDGRLKHYKSLHDIPEVRQPCVVFCGHPSLRFGDVTHLIETWGNNHMNTMIFTEPEFPYIECLAPYQPLAIKTVYCPIDTSLNFQQTNKLIKDLKPKVLVTHEEYLSPPKHLPHMTEYMIDFPTAEKIYPGSAIDIKLKKKSAGAMMEPRLANEIQPSVQEGLDASASTITAVLDNANNKYRLLKPSVDLFDPLKCPPTKYTWGSIDSAVLINRLAQEGITQAKTQHTSTGFTVSIPSENATITVEPNSTSIVCSGQDGASRPKLRRILISCLTEF